jgi:hypothetical protein
MSLISQGLSHDGPGSILRPHTMILWKKNTVEIDFVELITVQRRKWLHLYAGSVLFTDEQTQPSGSALGLSGSGQ